MIYDPEREYKKKNKIRQRILKASPVPTSATAAGDAPITRRTAAASAITATATAAAA